MTYQTRKHPIAAPPGKGGKLRVEIVRDGAVIGEYERNYSSFHRTFRAFTQGGREYALYSPHYTATRVMELPSCRDLGGEDPDPGGFCPVDYWVAQDGSFGLVAGCVWGDDSSWKLQFLDLSHASIGRVVRDDRFGYVELPDDLTLDDAVEAGANPPNDTFPGPWVSIRTVARFSVGTGRQMDSRD